MFRSVRIPLELAVAFTVFFDAFAGTLGAAALVPAFAAFAAVFAVDLGAAALRAWAFLVVVVVATDDAGSNICACPYQDEH